MQRMTTSPLLARVPTIKSKLNTMRVITTVTDAYQFHELSEAAQQKAIQKLSDCNIDYEWWESVYEDAENIGLKITGFDIDRASYVKAKFLTSTTDTATRILSEHGEMCETWKTANDYLNERNQIIDTWPKDEDGNFEDEYKMDDKLEDLDSEFLNSICEYYLLILTNEYEYLTSEEAIKETIEANEWEFTEQGNII